MYKYLKRPLDIFNSFNNIGSVSNSVGDQK